MQSSILKKRKYQKRTHMLPCVRVTKDIHDKISLIAFKSDTTISTIIRMSIDYFLSNIEKRTENNVN